MGQGRHDEPRRGRKVNRGSGLDQVIFFSFKFLANVFKSFFDVIHANIGIKLITTYCYNILIFSYYTSSKRAGTSQTSLQTRQLWTSYLTRNKQTLLKLFLT
jgi:hypothetical protein